jgi:hypothetical protein
MTKNIQLSANTDIDIRGGSSGGHGRAAVVFRNYGRISKVWSRWLPYDLSKWSFLCGKYTYWWIIKWLTSRLNTLIRASAMKRQSTLPLNSVQ